MWYTGFLNVLTGGGGGGDDGVGGGVGVGGGAGGGRGGDSSYRFSEIGVRVMCSYSDFPGLSPSYNYSM